jgi:hypothetical protein
LAVDGLAEEIGVAGVAGVFLDHVHHDPSEIAWATFAQIF